MTKATPGDSNCKIYKIDAKTGKPLAGVVFDVYNSQGQLVDTGVSDASGYYVPSVGKKTVTYTDIEREVPVPYQMTQPISAEIGA